MRRNPITKTIYIVRTQGVLSALIRALQKIEKLRQKKTTHKKQQFVMLAKYEDVLKTDWTLRPYKPSKKKRTPPFTINWVMSPPGKGSGGHQNIFRFINYLEQQGHTCRVYLYSANDFPSLKKVSEVLSQSYPPTKAAISWYEGSMEPSDAVFATGWETAYPVFNDPTTARRFYFVQDFEPYFYPLGSEYILAENTYKFNFHGITAGGWLANKLSKEYGMKCDNYDFGADTKLYSFKNTQPRKEIFFYARPVTARRGFEIGIMALEKFHKQHPDYTITLAGWDVSEYKIPFPYVNLKTLSLDQLSEVYNRSAAALVMSLTNMSLLPLELLACGVIPVVTDGENNRQVSNNPYIEYAITSPDALASALDKVVTKKDLLQYVKKASASVAGASWSEAGKRLEAALTKELHG